MYCERVNVLKTRTNWKLLQDCHPLGIPYGFSQLWASN